ncbi:MAG TPA: TonB family protein [Candidatus Eisenbacteria bacterium]|nr:TonB family protein [Candidatus Eisenbacteria bacterium]
MNAMAVPPSGWNPFGSREAVPARGSSRRNVKQGLALSALVHLSALGCILWIQAQHPEDALVLTRGRVDLVPPRVETPPLPRVGTTPPVRTDGGSIDPKLIMDDPKTEPAVVDPKVGIAPGGGETGNQPSIPGDDERAMAQAVVDPDPSEETFVAFDEPPVPIYNPDPAYPEWARENGIDGRVVLHALVGVDGRVRKVTVIRAIPGLSESAEETLYRWTFKPARAGRQPVAVWIEVPFSFRL